MSKVEHSNFKCLLGWIPRYCPNRLICRSIYLDLFFPTLKQIKICWGEVEDLKLCERINQGKCKCNKWIELPCYECSLFHCTVQLPGIDHHLSNYNIYNQLITCEIATHSVGQHEMIIIFVTCSRLFLKILCVLRQTFAQQTINLHEIIM